MGQIKLTWLGLFPLGLKMFRRAYYIIFNKTQWGGVFWKSEHNYLSYSTTLPCCRFLNPLAFRELEWLFLMKGGRNISPLDSFDVERAM